MNTAIEDDVALDLVALGRALWRAKLWIIVFVVGAAVLTFAGLQLIPSKYRGEAKILIESRLSVYPGAERAVETERALLDKEGVASQVQLLRSYDLGRRVAAKLKLSELKEFNSNAGGGSLLSRVPVMLGFAKDPKRASTEEMVLEAYFKNLKVYQVEKTRVITVEFSSQDRDLAALAANTVVEEYLAQQSAAKREATTNAADQLEPAIERVRGDVDAAERKVEEFRAGADLLLGANNVTLVQQQLGELNTQLATARAGRSEIQAKAGLLRELLDSGGSLESVSDVLNSPLIQRLRESQVAMQARIAELSTSLLPNHPQFRALRRQLQDLEAQIRSEAGKILIGLEGDAKISQARVDSLLASLNELKAAVTQSNEKRIELRNLERDAKIKSAQLEAMLTRYRDQGVRGTTNLPDARLISRASVPVKPYSPRVGAITAITAIAAMILSLVTVLLREFISGSALTRGHRSQAVSQDDETVSGGESYPSVPQPNRAPMVAPHVPAVPVSTFSTSPSALWQALLASDTPAKFIVVVTMEDDSVAHDVSLALLRTAVRDDICPILVDTLHQELVSGDEAQGLGELLSGEASFSQVIMRDPASRAHVIEAGGNDLSDELVTQPAFDTVMEALNHTYDHVVVDLGQLDDSIVAARFLSHADHVVIATGGSSDGPLLDRARRMLEGHNAKDVSVLGREAAVDAERAALQDMAA